jgi:hypothetical protein
MTKFERLRKHAKPTDAEKKQRIRKVHRAERLGYSFEDARRPARPAATSSRLAVRPRAAGRGG